MVKNTVLTPEQTNKALKRKRIKSKVGKIFAMCFIYFVLLMLYAPLIYVTVYSFSSHKITGLWGEDGFVLTNYISLFNMNNIYSKEIWSATLNTVLVAITAGLFSTIIGTLGAIGIYYLRKKWLKNTLDFVTQIPVVNAEIVTAVSLCILFVFIAKIFNIERTFFTLVIGHVVLTIPYVILSVQPKLEQMDPSLYEAAMDLGATQTQSLFKVIIPDIIPGILSGFMLSVTLSLDDFVITAFTRPNDVSYSDIKFNTISTYVDAKLAKGGLPNQFRSFTAILFAVILIVMTVMNIKSSLDNKKRIKKETN